MEPEGNKGAAGEEDEAAGRFWEVLAQGVPTD